MKQYTHQALREQIQHYIEKLPYAHPPLGLYAPIEYVLPVGGKRVRPVLTLLAYNLYREEVEEAFAQAAALETYHNFTLLHDDLMDNADVRRGVPTVHKRWDANTAILSGDAMLILAYQILQKDCPTAFIAPVFETFTKAALEVCEGQQWDVEFEQRKDVTEVEYIEMIRLKTAVLLGASLRIGAIMGGASEEDANWLYQFGEQMGIAFQLQDDWLDVYGDKATFGKNIGGDIVSNKKTFMLINALQKAEGADKKELETWISQKTFDAQEKISAVTAIYNKVGISALCQERMEQSYAMALQALARVSVPEERKTMLREYAQLLMNRQK